jgi:MFS family permease
MQSLSFLELLHSPRLSRLFILRWTGQAVDGIFQSALASFVLFSPERQASAFSAALAFAVVLLPYSAIGPFVGTLLDRVSRQRALLIANLMRATDLALIAFLVSHGRTGVELTVLVLTAFGINRLILAGLSAGLPLVVEPESLIAANAMAVTGGSVLVVVGGGIGLGLRKILEPLNSANHSDAILIAIAALGYICAATLSTRLRRREIGPLEHERKAASFSQGLVEMKAGIVFLAQHRDAFRGILATAVQRGGLTALVLVALLLERNTFHPSSQPAAGLAGVALALSIAGIGITVGAILAPIGVARFGRHAWIRIALIASGISPLFLALSAQVFSLYFAAFFTSLFGQSMKVTNDALVQSKIDDYFRGRVFAVYDVLVNGAIVLGALTAALILPTSGKTPLVPLFISIAYFLTAAWLLRPTRFSASL